MPTTIVLLNLMIKRCDGRTLIALKTLPVSNNWTTFFVAAAHPAFRIIFYRKVILCTVAILRMFTK